MGLEFALVHPPTKEAYDLGKWCGKPEWRTTPPASREEVHAYFVEYFNDPDDKAWDDLIEPVTDAVWAFIESHPGCFLVDEHDWLWSARDFDDRDRSAWGEDHLFREVGSRYDVKPAQHKRSDNG